MLIFNRNNFSLSIRVLFLDLRITLRDKDLDLFSVSLRGLVFVV